MPNTTMHESDSYNTYFYEACSSFDTNPGQTIDVLEDIALRLAQSRELRQQIGAGDPPVWPNLRALWQNLVQRRDEENGKDEERRMCVGLAKFTRNLVAGVGENQQIAFENEPDIRQMLHHYSSWSVMEEPETYTLTRILSQTLSNLVTSNETLMSKLWATYMTLTENQAILLRLLALPDARTVLAALVLILNCIHGSSERALMLCTTNIGARICVSLLDGMVKLYDAEDSHGTNAFDVGYRIFSCLVEEGLIPDLYVKLSVSGEPIAPHQITLLKLLDSYLQSARLSNPFDFSSLTSPALNPESLIEASSAESTRETALMEIYTSLAPMLYATFNDLAKYAKQAVARALGREDEGTRSADTKRTGSKGKSSRVEDRASTWFETDSSSGTEEFVDSKAFKRDVFDKSKAQEDTTGQLAFRERRRDANVDEATPRPSVDDTTPRASEDVANRSRVREDPTTGNPPPAELDVLLPRVCEALVLVTQCIVTVSLEADDLSVISGGENLKDLFNDNRDGDGQGIVECLIELLRLLGDFLPRINFGKPVLSPAPATPPAAQQLAATGFSYLKRDLVRLLGILCHERKAVQDSVRTCGGLEIVMNLCVVDERNPYIREHAIFTLHNLLAANPENQAVVDAIQPTRDWNEEGVLQ